MTNPLDGIDIARIIYQISVVFGAVLTGQSDR